LRYEVRDRDTGKTVTIKIPEEWLISRYGEVTQPSTMGVRDYACREGVFSWSRYTRLAVRKK
jgi:hypothetical protein